MRQQLQQFYHHLPPLLKTAVVSLYGYHLRGWRFSENTDRLTSEALERDHWTGAQWAAWQREHLSELLHKAATEVPYYAAYWQKRRAKGDRASFEHLENWPVLSKEEVREQPRAFVREGLETRKLFKLNSSGTSGTPMQLWRSRDANRAWYALFEARWRRWHGVTRHDRWALIGGRLIVPAERKKPPFWVYNAALKQLYLSPSHISPDNVAAYLKALETHEVSYLIGFASSMYAVAQMTRQQGLKAPQLKVVISQAESLSDAQRRCIGDVFACPVINTYGMSEAVMAAGECAHGTMHLWPDVGVIEVLQDDADTPVAANGVGRFICTGLLNSAMPLVRYEVGDRGAVSTEPSNCACGRTLPELLKVEGRMIDNIVTPDGRKIFWLGAVLNDLPIFETQIVQMSHNALHVKVVPLETYSEHDSETLRQRLIERVGTMTVTVERVQSIPRTKSGKFRFIVNNTLAP